VCATGCISTWGGGGGHLLVDTRQLYVGGVVSNVHKCGVNHLVVNSVLGAITHAASTSVQIVDEQRAHLALLDHVRCLNPEQNSSKKLRDTFIAEQ
jgi:hypothetical protein